MTTTFETGDIVQLKSGVPKMAVKGTLGDDKHSFSKKMKETALIIRGFQFVSV